MRTVADSPAAHELVRRLADARGDLRVVTARFRADAQWRVDRARTTGARTTANTWASRRAGPTERIWRRTRRRLMIGPAPGLPHRRASHRLHDLQSASAATAPAPPARYGCAGPRGRPWRGH
ncbi:hypothetical protein OG361_02510 [Streptomyces sp. NBC_00090]|uniref:hypothetical protein n=1 Tax=Streptomyces sp. NBC_00090 TaxID=2903619 RepID=UPI003246F681